MALQKTLEKQNNSLCADFRDAYWRIDDLIFYNKEGIDLVRFCLNCYASRESSKQSANEWIKPTLSFGGSPDGTHRPILYTWVAEFRTQDVFPYGIPNTLIKQKEVLYPFVKNYLTETFIDV